MSTDVFFKSDIACILTAQVQATMNAMAASGEVNRQYIAGFRAAISGVALACGIEPARVLPDEPLGGGYGGSRLMLED